MTSGATPAAAPKSEQFPRSSELPFQSPKYWAKEKDRYLRQLMIKDIEAASGRPLIVFFSQLSQEITHSDPDDLSEILSGLSGREADILIQTPGGSVDATEKIISVLRQRLDSYRVIVPSWAKSAGTVIALSSEKIVLGINSELGPIDPQWNLGGSYVPCDIVAADPNVPTHLKALASRAVTRMRKLAKDILQRGMMTGTPDADIDDLLNKISSSAGYLSHGAVIDYEEAQKLGLSVEFLAYDSEEWRRIWLLYCLYEYDMKAKNLGKIFEGSLLSIARQKA